jgi:hypothetical protein
MILLCSVGLWKCSTEIANQEQLSEPAGGEVIVSSEPQKEEKPTHQETVSPKEMVATERSFSVEKQRMDAGIVDGVPESVGVEKEADPPEQPKGILCNSPYRWLRDIQPKQSSAGGPLIHHFRLSADGSRLFLAITGKARYVTESWDTSASTPTFIAGTYDVTPPDWEAFLGCAV